MNKLNQMIQEMCPDRVEYKTLKDICVTILHRASLQKSKLVENNMNTIEINC